MELDRFAETGQKFDFIFSDLTDTPLYSFPVVMLLSLHFWKIGPSTKCGGPMKKKFPTSSRARLLRGDRGQNTLDLKNRNSAETQCIVLNFI